MVQNHEMLQVLCAELGMQDDVLFTGNIANVEDYYAISDVYANISKRGSVADVDSGGDGQLDCRLFLTNVGGIRDVVKQNGYLIEDGDYDALIEKMTSQHNMTMRTEVYCQANQEFWG